MIENPTVVEAAGRIIDLMSGGKLDWRKKLHESDFLESADWLIAMAYARTATVVAEDKVARMQEAFECADRFLAGLVDVKDFEEPAADGGVTVGMVFQHGAAHLRTVLARSTIAPTPIGEP